MGVLGFRNQEKEVLKPNDLKDKVLTQSKFQGWCIVHSARKWAYLPQVQGKLALDKQDSVHGDIYTGALPGILGVMKKKERSFLLVFQFLGAHVRGPWIFQTFPPYTAPLHALAGTIRLSQSWRYLGLL